MVKLIRYETKKRVKHDYYWWAQHINMLPKDNMDIAFISPLNCAINNRVSGKYLDFTLPFRHHVWWNAQRNTVSMCDWRRQGWILFPRRLKGVPFFQGTEIRVWLFSVLCSLFISYLAFVFLIGSQQSLFRINAAVQCFVFSCDLGFSALMHCIWSLPTPHTFLAACTSRCKRAQLQMGEN